MPPYSHWGGLNDEWGRCGMSFTLWSQRIAMSGNKMRFDRTFASEPSPTLCLTVLPH